MGFPITQLSRAKFVSGVRVCISIRDQRERLCIGGVGVFYTNTPTKNNLNVMKVGVPNAKLGIIFYLILNIKNCALILQQVQDERSKKLNL